MESIVSGAKSLYDIALLEVRNQVIQAMKDTYTTADAVQYLVSLMPKVGIHVFSKGLKQHTKWIHQRYLLLCCK